MTKPLSPAAQAVLDAADSAFDQAGTTRQGIAAALQAAADQAIPMTKTPWGSTLVPVLTAQESRERILAIAAELEVGND
jgi:hypothetical protein